MPDDLDDQQEEPGRLRRMYEEEAQARAEAQSRLADLERREAFRDAGLDPNNPQHRAFAKAYDGPMNPEAVGDYVTELGINQAPPSAPEPPQPVTPADDQAALIRIAEAARDTGGAPPSSDAAQRIRKEMEVAARRGDSSALDRLSIELSRANGNQTKWDQPDIDAPSIPAGTPRMPIVTQPGLPH